MMTRKELVEALRLRYRIAALCIENGVSLLWSADRDFGRFKRLKTVNPLV